MTDILAIFPHPDDETWIAGGMLNQCVRSGLHVRVVSLTAGEKGWDRTGQYSSQEQMAEVRAKEFHAACAALGVEDKGLPGFPDGALDVSEVSAWITQELERCRPRFVLTFGEDGGYGHLDHIATFDAVAECVENCAHEFVWLTALASDGRTAGVWRALRKLRTTTPIVAEDFPERRKRAIRRPTQTVPLDDEAKENKHEALRAHHSQLRDGDPLTFLDQELIASLMSEETLAFEHGTPAAFGQFIRDMTPRT